MPITIPPDLEPLATDVAVRAVGAAPDLVLNQLGHAFREFCTRSTAWREATQVTTVVNVADYDITVTPSNVLPLWLMSASLGGVPIGKWQPPYGSQTLTWGQAGVSNGAPRMAGCPSPGRLRLWPKPDQAYTLDLEVAVVPTGDFVDAEPPEGFMTLHHDVIAAGALARLYVIPNTPFSSPTLAKEMQTMFRNGVRTARVAVEATLTRGLQPTAPFPRPAGSIPA